MLGIEKVAFCCVVTISLGYGSRLRGQLRLLLVAFASHERLLLRVLLVLLLALRGLERQQPLPRVRGSPCLPWGSEITMSPDATSDTHCSFEPAALRRSWDGERLKAARRRTDSDQGRGQEEI